MFAFSLHKAGSTLFTKILDDLARAANIAVVNIPGELFPQGIHEVDFPALKADFFQPKGYIYSGYRTFPEMFEFPETMAEHAGLLIRDPRDILVSMYFSFTGSHPIAQKDPEIRKKIEDNRRRENERGICRYILRHAGMVEQEFRSYEDHLKQLKVWRYEDVIFDKFNWVRGIANRFKIKLPEAKIREIAEKHDIRPKEEKPGDHIRRVAPGDAQEKLSPRMLEYLDRRFRRIMRVHKYETNAERQAADAAKPKSRNPVDKAMRWVRKKILHSDVMSRPKGSSRTQSPCTLRSIRSPSRSTSTRVSRITTSSSPGSPSSCTDTSST
ncbi:MAG: sulfotransferase domain-containing protein [Planctomycetaceae bacterium]